MKPSIHWIRHIWDEHRWTITGILWMIAFGLGDYGFCQYAASQGQPATQLDAIYLTFQLIPMNSGAVPGPIPWQLEVARFTIPALTALTAIQAFLQLFRQQTELADWLSTATTWLSAVSARKDFCWPKISGRAAIKWW